MEQNTSSGQIQMFKYSDIFYWNWLENESGRVTNGLKYYQTHLCSQLSQLFITLVAAQEVM